jgi:hypothetical protein
MLEEDTTCAMKATNLPVVGKAKASNSTFKEEIIYISYGEEYNRINYI